MHHHLNPHHQPCCVPPIATNCHNSLSPAATSGCCRLHRPPSLTECLCLARVLPPPQIQYAHDEEHRHVYHMAKGVIYIGTFKAVSHNQPAKYESGKIQLAYPAPNLFETDWVVDDQLPSHDYFITKNGRIELEFVESEAH